MSSSELSSHRFLKTAAVSMTFNVIIFTKQSEGFQEVLARYVLSLGAKITVCINLSKPTELLASASSEFEAKFSKHLKAETRSRLYKRS